VDHLVSQCLAQKTVGIVHIYFRYNDEKQQTVAEMAESILQQLIQRRGTIDPDIKAMHENHTAKKIRPTAKTLINLIESQVEKLERVFMVIDALDECPESKRREFLRELNRLPSKINLFLTSRDDTKISPLVAQEVIIRASDDDAHRYVESCLEEENDNPRLGYHLQVEPLLREGIIKKVTQRADRMCISNLINSHYPCSLLTLE
jgi:ankyrin repeat domain-containing protein 50